MALAGMTIAMALPYAIFGPIAGVLVDRVSRKYVMIVSDLARSVIVAGLFFAPDIITLLVLVFLKEVFSTFFSPAKQAALVAVVPEDDLLAANSLSQLSGQASKVLGPVLGGLIVTIGGPRATFLVDSATFLASAVILSQLPGALLKPAPDAEQQHESLWGDFRAGLSYILGNFTLAAAIASMTAALVLIFTFDSLGALALQALGVGEELLGLAVGAIGLGTAIGAALIGQFGGRAPPLRIMGAGQIGSGIMVAVIGFAVIANLNAAGVSFIPLWLVVGLTGAAMFVPFGFVLQRETAPEYMGRVFSTSNSLQTIFQLIAPAAGAVLAGALGVGVVFAGAGIVLALLGVGVLFIPATQRPSVVEVPST